MHEDPCKTHVAELEKFTMETKVSSEINNKKAATCYLDTIVKQTNNYMKNVYGSLKLSSHKNTVIL